MAVVSLSPTSAWTAGFATNDLNSLAHGSLVVSTLTAPQIDNSAGGSLFVKFEVSLGVLSPTVGANILVFLIPESTTTGTYMSGSNGAVANDHYKWQNGPYGIVSLRLTGSTAQIQRSPLVQLDANERYIIGFLNRSGVSLAASGNQVMYRTFTELVA